MKGFVKDPDATLDYGFDWGPWLDSDTISTSSWAADSGVTIESEDYDFSITTVFLSGGTAGEKYTIKNTITTAGGRTDERSFQLRIKQR